MFKSKNKYVSSNPLCKSKFKFSNLENNSTTTQPELFCLVKTNSVKNMINMIEKKPPVPLVKEPVPEPKLLYTNKFK